MKPTATQQVILDSMDRGATIERAYSTMTGEKFYLRLAPHATSRLREATVSALERSGWIVRGKPERTGIGSHRTSYTITEAGRSVA